MSTINDDSMGVAIPVLSSTGAGVTTSIVGGGTGGICFDEMLEYAGIGLGITTVCPTLTGISGASAEPGYEVVGVIVAPAEASFQTKAIDQVEENAKKVYDRFDHNHDETKIDNAAIVSNDVETTKELQKLLNKQEKNQLLNELESLKEYKNNKKLTLK